MSNSPSPSPLPFFTKLVLILAAVLGGPAAAFTFFSQFITEHPLPAVIIGLFYEMGVLILGFIAEVGQELRQRWVSRCVEWLDNIIQGSFSPYWKEYCGYLRYQYRDFDVRGLTTLGPYSLELDQIFVELYIDPAIPKQVSSNPIPQSRALSERNHSLWDYLASKHLTNQHLMILGAPGSGKTTLLKHVTLALVAHKKQRYHREKIPHTFPIILFLRDHVQCIGDQPDFSLVHALRDHLRKWRQSEPPVRWIERQLTKRRCLVMLDGLDEVADPEARRKVVDWIQTQMIAFKENRFVVTSRPFGFHSNQWRLVTVLKVRPFANEQISLFVQKWYLANEIMEKRNDDPEIWKKARTEAEALLQRLRNTPALFVLTVNPLLLTMIATVHRYSGSSGLPGNRKALYDEICEVFLGKCQQEPGGQVLELTPAQVQRVLEPLAYFLMLKGERDVTVAEAQDAIKEPLEVEKLGMLPEAFLRLVENGSGLLLEQENSVYRFAHLTFQEYLAAVHIRKKQLGNTLIAHMEENWWQETIRLYCAMADATPIIDACLKDDSPSVHALTLALNYAEEASNVQPVVEARLETILKQCVEDADQERRRIVAEALLSKRQRQMVSVKEGVYRDRSLITCAEYQVFLDEQQKQGRDHQPAHWNSISFPVGSGQVPILGIRRSDALAFCNWLTTRNAEGWHYRLPRVEEWSLEERRGQRELLAETGYWVEDEPYFVWSRGKPSNILRQQLSDCIDLDLDCALDRDLTLNLDRAIARDRGLVLDLTHDPTRARDLALNLARSRALSLARSLTRALDHDRDLALARDYARALVRAFAFDFALDLALDRARDLARALDLAFDLAFDLARDQVRTFARTLALDLALDLTCDYNRAFDLAIAHALDLVRFPARDRNHARALNLYITLFILQGRVVGKLPIYEGILLVRYR